MSRGFTTTAGKGDVLGTVPSAFLMHEGWLLSVPIAFFLQGIYDLIEVSIWPGKLENRAKQGIII